MTHRDSGKHYNHDYSFTIKDTQRARLVKEPLMGNQGISPSRHINVFTNQEAPLTFSIQGFHWDFITLACFIKSLAT